MRFGAFTFAEEFKKHRGLAMGSLLSAVMVSLYKESLEKDEYEEFMEKKWFNGDMSTM